MSLRLFNTLTKTKEDFVPLDPRNVRMYVCGPTVYDFAHIGNARPAIVFDVLFRLLRHDHGDAHVTYVRNVTDVDDKINTRAAERGISIRELTEETQRIYDQDVAALGCLPPTRAPRATEHIGEMVAMIEALIAAGNAYVAEGHVLFDVSSKPDYGKLSRRSLDEMLAGARVEIAPYKKNPMDFVLWKPSEPPLPGWMSPWGRGRPGWHIECSAMAGKYLGETFDIHGGGIDLLFPHHENEIAQSESAHHGHPLAKIWMHNGFLQVEGEKMSKSLGNFFTIRELLDKWPGDVLRFNMLKTNYDQPLNWQYDGLIRAANELRVWSELVAQKIGENTDLNRINAEVDTQLVDALSDNLNTHLALTRLGQLFHEAKSKKSNLDIFVKSALFLGFKHINKPGYFDLSFAATVFKSGPQITEGDTIKIISYRASVANASVSSISSDQRLKELSNKGFVLEINDAGVLSVSNTTSADFEKLINQRITERADAKKRRDFKTADKIRQELLKDNNIELEDKSDGTTSWRAKR